MGITGEQIAKAVQTLAKGTQVSYDRTYEMIIDEIEDVEAGRYRVSNEGNLNVPAVCVDSLKGKLSVGDKVLVKVPNGDFSSISDSTTNLIEYKVSGKVDSEAIQELKNRYYESGIKISDIYDYDNGRETAIGLVAGQHDTETVLEDSTERAAADALFATYAQSFKYMRLSAKFKTALNESHSHGNYGVRATFKVLAENGELVDKTYILDFSSFVGTPYEYTFFNTQEAIFDMSAEQLSRLVSLEFFEEGFDYDHYATGGLNTETPNLFVQDIDIQFLDKLEIEPDTYYLYIETPDGAILKDQSPSVRLIGKLVYNTSYIDLSDCSCQWYKKDLSVTTSSEYYNKLAGYGWKYLDNTTDTLIVNSGDVATQETYKLIVKYNDVVVSASTLVAQFAALYRFNIERDFKKEGGKSVAYLKLNKINGNESLIGDWYVTLPGGQYSLIVTGENNINIEEYLMYSYANFECQVYLQDSSADSSIGIASFFLDNTQQDDEVIFVTFSGQDLYHYDADGQISISERDTPRALFAKVYNMVTGDDPTRQIRDRVWSINGHAITSTAYDPENSMLRGVTLTGLEGEENLQYYIKKSYKADYINNTITLTITTFDGKEHVFEKDITFLKDGDQGTNGTGYAVKVYPQDSSGEEITSGFTGITSDAGIRVGVKVFSEDEQLQSGYTCMWSASSNLTIGSDTGSYTTVKVKNYGAVNFNIDVESALEYWVKAVVTITANNKSITTYYPIDVAKLGGSDDIALNELNLSSLLSYVKYSASGYSPEYQNTKIALKLNNEVITLSNWDDTSSSAYYKIKVLNTNLLNLYSDNTRIIPTNYFDYYKTASSKKSHTGLVLLKLKNTYILHTVFMYLNTYGNEAINSWDGTELVIDPNRQYILAPQIGAGIKETDNTFTGVVMGKDTTQDKIGLYGYQHGKTSFALMDDGTAFFGKADSGGRITINGEAGIISGGDVTVNGDTISPAAMGMYLRLGNKSTSATGAVTSDAKAIGIGWDSSKSKEKFYVKYDGTLYCTGATVDGTLIAGNGSKIGGWTITNNKLQNDTGTVYLGIDGIGLGDKFIVDSSGDVTMSGSINLSNASSITWNSSYPPVKYQFSVDGTSNWHNTMASTDYYRRDSLDGGNSYGTAYQFRGKDGHDGADGSDANVPRYIRNTHIDMTKVSSPYIIGGLMYATGVGDSSTGSNPQSASSSDAGTKGAYYIADGVTGSGENVRPGTLKGWLCYDNTGAGTEEEAKYRVFLHSEDNTALKLEAGAGLSIEARDSIHIMSPLRVHNILVLGSNCYGSTRPSSGTTGQLFFEI